MTATSLLLISSAAVIVLVWLVAWFLMRVMRGELDISVNTALLLLLAAILVVPFAMNFAAHTIANSLHRTSGAESADGEHGNH